MLRWQLNMRGIDPIMGNIASSDITQEQRRNERSFGRKIPWENSSSLGDSAKVDLVRSAKAVFEAFSLKAEMEVNGAESVNIFCRCPYTNIELKLNGDGEITIGSKGVFAFTQKQFEVLLEFAETIKEEGLFYQE